MIPAAWSRAPVGVIWPPGPAGRATTIPGCVLTGALFPHGGWFALPAAAFTLRKATSPALDTDQLLAREAVKAGAVIRSAKLQAWRTVLADLLMVRGIVGNGLRNVANSKYGHEAWAQSDYGYYVGYR